MTNEEICKKFSRICNDCFDRNCPNPCYARDLYNVFMKVCELKDVQFATQKKTLINKACKWLKEQESWDYYNDAPCKLMSKDKIAEFRKAMEDEK